MGIFSNFFCVDNKKGGKNGATNCNKRKMEIHKKPNKSQCQPKRYDTEVYDNCGNLVAVVSHPPVCGGIWRNKFLKFFNRGEMYVAIKNVPCLIVRDEYTGEIKCYPVPEGSRVEWK